MKKTDRIIGVLSLCALVCFACFVCFVCFVCFACSTPDTTARIDPIGPDRASFDPVARVLVARCGTIDCHGSVTRNLRLYGFGGLRLKDAAGNNVAPDYAGDIQPNEVTANYEAVIALEPEKMRAVVLEHAGAEELTLIRKGRGEEQHKGLNAMNRGDDADQCIVSWLSSSGITSSACTIAAPPKK